ncbi:E3 ubiquitin-protein ligase At3g02290-like isoform X2 [Durio zibethinus]|uniref:RING-type E3 ubiquitin transferase n=1 Tax=Durio zibethinus TaxID=66656 RepID=A0A6P5XGH5_DURZI|nr:E3 ubiquitin-protein ligase At3g02290-like isoform X2 [Durio zibethinus]
MGAFCCCPCGDDYEEYAYPSNSIYRHCICLRFFFYQLFTGYGALFHRLEGRPVSSQIQGASLSSMEIVTTTPNISANETHVTMSRPVPYDTEQRYSRLQRDGLVSRRDKSVTHFQEETQPLRRSISSSGVESLGIGRKRYGVESEEDSKIVNPESSERTLALKVAYGSNYLQSSSEDEDVCPTCLDENPKITARCSHHFHLGCIYEWLERSESCPICGKEMEFCESP